MIVIRLSPVGSGGWIHARAQEGNAGSPAGGGRSRAQGRGRGRVRGVSVGTGTRSGFGDVLLGAVLGRARRRALRCVLLGRTRLGRCV